MDETMIRIDVGDLERRRSAVAPRHRFVDQQRELVEVLDPAVNLCVWRRAIGTGLARWLDETRARQKFFAQADLAAASPDASALVASLAPSAERDELQADIERVAGSYLALVGAPGVLATLATISDAWGRRFVAGANR